jgi:hypothetical protein
VKDRRIARVVRAIQDLPEQDLFQHVDERGVCRSIGSSDVNDSLREISSSDVSAKDFRIWGTVLAAMALSAIGPFANKKDQRVPGRRGGRQPAALHGHHLQEVPHSSRDHCLLLGGSLSGWIVAAAQNGSGS